MKIGIIGTGLMGSSVAKCLFSKGISLVVYNRTRSKAEKLCSEIGCRVVGSPKDLGDVDFIVIFVFDDKALYDVVYGDKGLLAMPRKDVFILNSSTVSPETSERIYSELESHGLRYYEVPVYGSVDEALSCRLVSLVAGMQEGLDTVKRFLANYSSEIFYVGDIPKAMALKLALNNIGLSMPALLAESLALMEAYGVEDEIFEEVSSKLWFGNIVKRYVSRAKRTGKVRFTVRGAAKDYTVISRALDSKDYPSIVSSALKNYYRLASTEYGSEDYPRAMNWILKKKT